MAKSFCSGCKHWKHYVHSFEGFYYCAYLSTKFSPTWELKKRKEKCNGKYWEESV